MEPTGRLYVDASDGGIGAVLETIEGKFIKTYQAKNKLMLPIYKLEWCALWKGITKLRNIASQRGSVVTTYGTRTLTVSPLANTSYKLLTRLLQHPYVVTFLSGCVASQNSM
eukprot:GHVP01031764.1.p2 GENE.GHVP01031764.1~~GHVP01031764.1.p2  ORF type:complete len:112 (-),score=6.83 GHVP01031764.1:450-785(-)